ncbi:DUF4376 domain-containing protein [Variovorax boronicumulans]|uniref:DUF4376 domain-containing protein n=1 Tax=Variovorax boronicumulans TaxID=436515 RepID=UPI000BB2CF60|nr:DUF4376 domain-containing protein [Variovorax boronicumulans]
MTSTQETMPPVADGLPVLATLALYKPTAGRPTSGEIQMTTTVDESRVEYVAQMSGLAYVRVSSHQTGYVCDGVVVPYPQRPSEAHVFDFVADTWVDPRTLEQRKDAMRALVAQRRWEAETGGITMPNGMRVLTGRADRDNIAALILTAEAAGIAVVDFKAANGWGHLTLEEVREVARAIALHVQACFSAERAHHDAMKDLTEAEIDAYDLATLWPLTHNSIETQ